MPYVSDVARIANGFRRRVLHRHTKLTLEIDDYLAFAERAERDGRSIPKSVTELAKAQLGLHAYVPGELVTSLRDVSRQLRALGTHTNQVARACNLQAKRHTEPEAEQCLTWLKNVHQQLATIEQIARQGINRS